MRLTTRLLPFALCSLAAASLFGTQEVLSSDIPAVPGDNPLTYCEDPSDYLLNVTYVNLTPNPPAAGVTLSIDAAGTFLKEIQDGAYVDLTVKYGLITLLRTRQDLCEQLGNVDEKCPIHEGKLVVTKDVRIPKEIPPGKYTVKADVYTVDDDQIVCMAATVGF